MTQQELHIVWFKRDLRIHDHLPLSSASESGRYLGLYIYEQELLEAADFDAAHLQFINQSLRDLRRRLRELGTDLVLRLGEATEVFGHLKAELGIKQIWAHEETGNAISYARDRRVRRWCREHNVSFKELPQHGVVRRLKNRDGWSRQWQKKMQSPTAPPPRKAIDVRIESPGEIAVANRFRMHSFDREETQVGGEAEGNELLGSFLQYRGTNYRSEMSSPVTATTSCSRLSPYIAYGNVSMRQIFQATNERVAELKRFKSEGQSIDPNWLKSLSSFKSRLSWHCHFIQKLEDEPDIEFQNFNRAYDGLREDEFDRSLFEAWCHGQTGYPMIDACMRALQKTGWINFRMRAMLMSFAAYHLWLHWREPSIYLARLFIDYEPGIHYSQCQMQSGVTGINTVRIYSPIKQVTDQDPKGIFIRRYCPELEGLPDKHLAEPHKMTLMEQSFYGCAIGTDYPPPVVDHKQRYQAARDRIHAVKKSSESKNESKKVYQKHGSRKQPMSRRS